jgi:hypothetical protein
MHHNETIFFLNFYLYVYIKAFGHDLNNKLYLLLPTGVLHNVSEKLVFLRSFNGLVSLECSNIRSD